MAKKGKKVSIFVDGEGFLNMLGNIFCDEEFDRTHYVPPKADWEGFFTAIAKSLGADTIKVYWYSIREVDYFPEGNWKTMPFEEAEAKLKRISIAKKELKNLVIEKDRRAVVNEFRYTILKNRKKMEAYFANRNAALKKMADKYSDMRVRRPGWQACSLIDRKTLPPKAVMGGMITDLFSKSGDYDIAILLTGDGEIVPAVNALSYQNKQFACLNFPVTASRKPARVSRKLVDQMDFILDIPVEDLAEFMGIELVKINGKSSGYPVPSTGVQGTLERI